MMQANQLVLFSLGKETYAFPIIDVKEIIRFQKISRIPDIPDYIEGMINLRGKIITVINLVKLFDCQTSVRLEDSTIIVDKSSGIGFIVDEVNEIRSVDEGDTIPYVDVTGQFGKSYIKDIARIENKIIAVIDPEKMLEHDTKKATGPVQAV